jgi:hypothetical protein
LAFNGVDGSWEASGLSVLDELVVIVVCTVAFGRLVERAIGSRKNSR